MTTDDRPEDDAADVERTIAEIDRESERVGVDWSRVAEALLGAHPELAPTPDELADEVTIGLDAQALLPLLRRLPDRAGTGALLEALAESRPLADDSESGG